MRFGNHSCGLHTQARRNHFLYWRGCTGIFVSMSTENCIHTFCIKIHILFFVTVHTFCCCKSACSLNKVSAVFLKYTFFKYRTYFTDFGT